MADRIKLEVEENRAWEVRGETVVFDALTVEEAEWLYANDPNFCEFELIVVYRRDFDRTT